MLKMPVDRPTAASFVAFAARADPTGGGSTA